MRTKVEICRYLLGNNRFLRSYGHFIPERKCNIIVPLTRGTETWKKAICINKHAPNPSFKSTHSKEIDMSRESTGQICHLKQKAKRKFRSVSKYGNLRHVPSWLDCPVKFVSKNNVN